MVDPTPSQIRAALAGAGQRLEDARLHLTDILAEIGILLRSGDAAGLEVTEMADLARISRPTAYRYLGRTSRN